MLHWWFDFVWFVCFFLFLYLIHSAIRLLIYFIMYSFVMNSFISLLTYSFIYEHRARVWSGF